MKKKKQKFLLKIYKSFKEENAESEKFWLSLPPEKRVEIVDSLLVDMLKLKGKKNENFPRLRRVCKIIKQK